MLPPAMRPMISSLPYSVLFWFVASLALLLFLHGRTLRDLWREPILAHPVVIVESDDWGTGPESDADMLRGIAGRLAAIRDTTGHSAVMTLGIVSGEPDGAGILASGFARYHRRTLAEPAFAPIVEAIRAGCIAGVFALQRHGLEHCWPAALLRRAGEDKALQRWLSDPMARSETLPSPLQSRWIDASALPSRSLPKEEIETAVAEEAALLNRIFGEAPSVAVPNTFVWGDEVEQAWVATGVTCIVTPGHRLEGRDAVGGLQPPTRRIRNGDRTASGAVQVVRDDYFEPSRGHRAEQVWEAVEVKALLGRPTLLETHRESFIGEPGIAELALNELERALRGVLDRRSDARFMSTVALARHLADPTSALRVRSFGTRIGPYLHRILNETDLHRVLKFSGLRIPLRFIARMIDRVTHGHFLAVAK